MQRELKKSRFHSRLRLRYSLILLVFMSCGQQAHFPKPRAFPRIDFPQRSFHIFDENYCQFTFEMPDYVKVEQDRKFFNEVSEDPCWFNLFYPDFDCRIHCTYYPISDEAPLEKLHNDAFKFAMEHNKKATYIDELRIEKPNHVSGFIFNLEGPVATPFQFYLTDSVQHFLRGSLYFNTQIRPDSLAPLYEFVKQDITHLVNTFKWKQRL